MSTEKTAPAYERLSTVKKGEHRGRPRVYLQGKWLARGAFTAGSAIRVEALPACIVIQLDARGDRVVSGKKDGAIPVVDLCSEALDQGALAGCTELQIQLKGRCIYITPARTSAKRATRCKNGKEGALFAGGGFLSQAAKQAGFEPAWAVEWDERYAATYERNHPGAKMFNMSISEVPLDALAPVELLTIGVPCEPFSTKRRSSDKALPPEAHELGDMVFWALRIVDHLNPDKVVVEEVPGFLDAGAGYILVHALRRMGYCVEHKVIDSTDYNGVTRRKRAVVVASSSESVQWPAVEEHTAVLGDYLDPATDDQWFDAASKSWLFDHWAKQEAKGNNFSNQKFSAESPRIGAVGKRYFSQQGDGVVIKHPSRPDTYRWLTLSEVKKLHGVPAGYYLGESKTEAGEVLGQGVVVTVFEKVIRSVAGRN